MQNGPDVHRRGCPYPQGYVFPHNGASDCGDHLQQLGAQIVGGGSTVLLKKTSHEALTHSHYVRDGLLRAGGCVVRGERA